MFEKGLILIKEIYSNFSHYFKAGELIIGGSYFYQSLGIHDINATFRDIDLIIDRKDRRVVPDLLDFFNSHEDYYIAEGKFIVNKKNDIIGIDIFRDDLSSNLGPAEIYPGIFTNYPSQNKLIEVYDFLIDRLKSFEIKQISPEKFKTLKSQYEKIDFKKIFESNIIPEDEKLSFKKFKEYYETQKFYQKFPPEDVAKINLKIDKYKYLKKFYENNDLEKIIKNLNDHRV